jgi:Asp-tRNA(Asn)/Glu-tRNA(Gln) amidotransferase C subunit
MSTIDVDTLRRAARLAGFDFADADLEALRPAVERALSALERLEALPLASVEPVTQFRIV